MVCANFALTTRYMASNVANYSRLSVLNLLWRCNAQIFNVIEWKINLQLGSGSAD